MPRTVIVLGHFFLFAFMNLEYRCYGCAARYPARVAMCLNCGSNLIGVDYRRTACEVLAGPCEVKSAAELVGRRAHREVVEGVIWGRISIIYGPPGGGKSSYALKVAAAHSGNKLVFSLEEGLSDTVSSRLEFLEIHDDSLYVANPSTVNEMRDLIEQYNPCVLVIDSVSVSTLVGSDLQAMSRDGMTLIGILQVVKDGSAQGKMDLLHLADVVVYVEGMNWKIEKSRYQGLEAGGVRA